MHLYLKKKDSAEIHFLDNKCGCCKNVFADLVQTLNLARFKNILAVKIAVKNGQKRIIFDSKGVNRSAAEVLILGWGAKMKKKKRPRKTHRKR